MPNDFYACLTIDQSSNFAIHIACARVQEYSKVGMPGLREYFFVVNGKIRHPTGHFAYEAADIVFGTDDFERFLQGLTEIRSGAASFARLSNVGEMFVLTLESRGRELHCNINIREFQPGVEETTLTASFKVDYDLFVNKLAAVLNEFMQSLKSVAPEPTA